MAEEERNRDVPREPNEWDRFMKLPAARTASDIPTTSAPTSGTKTTNAPTTAEDASAPAVAPSLQPLGSGGESLPTAAATPAPVINNIYITVTGREAVEALRPYLEGATLNNWYVSADTFAPPGGFAPLANPPPTTTPAPAAGTGFNTTTDTAGQDGATAQANSSAQTAGLAGDDPTAGNRGRGISRSYESPRDKKTKKDLKRKGRIEDNEEDKGDGDGSMSKRQNTERKDEDDGAGGAGSVETVT